MTKEELNCQESDEEIERLPNISTLLRASEFINLGIINDHTMAVTATVQATFVAATVEAMLATTMPGTTVPAQQCHLEPQYLLQQHSLP